jgi:hypothetical protein
MTSQVLRPWIEAVALHPDVLSESFSEDIFALDLGPLADYLAAKERGASTKDLPSVPTVYRDAEQFFRASFLTTGLRSLLSDVLDRLGGGGGNRVLKLMTPFGGGKSHTLASLLHAARNREALDRVSEAQGLSRPGKARVAVFDGQFFDAKTGKALPGTDLRARTMWGWIAWSLRGKEGYELLREQDEARVAPGGDELIALFQEGPNLLLLDEVLEYLISTGGVKVEKTTLRDETLSFLKRLTVAVGTAQNTALVFSLQSSKRESLEYVNLLQTVDHLASRKDQRREPVEGNEILSVIQRRLLAGVADPKAATDAASAFQQVVTQMRRAYARSAAEQQQAEEEGLALRDRIRSAYPFHPALIDVMRERWAAIPDFQRTRGALRFLAACLRASHREGKARSVLGPGDVPIHDSEVRLAFFKEVGQQADFQAVLEHDFIGANARARRIDERRAREVPGEAGKRPATRLATAILMYSFGGLRRDSGSEGDVLPPGITEPELMAVCVGPDLDSTTAQACLKELKEQCLYLHYDGVRYCFKKDPNVTLLVEQEADSVGRDEVRVRSRISEMLEERLAGQRTANIWPSKSSDVPDNDPSFLVAYMPFEFGTKTTRETEGIEFFERAGVKQREYRNGIGVAVPSEDQIEALRRSVRYILAIEQVRSKSKQLNLTDAQKDQLRERESTERAAAESSLLKLYTEIWLPRVNNGGLGIEKIAIGGRPLQTTLDEKKRALIHQRIMELLTIIQPRVFSSVAPSKISELFKLGEGDPARLGLKTSDVVAGFFSFLGFPRLTGESAIRRAIAQGIEKGVFGYTTGSPTLGADGRYQVDRARLRFECVVSEDEVDLAAGFVIAPKAIPLLTAPTAAGAGDIGTTSGGSPGTPKPVDTGPTTQGQPGHISSPPPGSALRTAVEFAFNADRNQLFSAWNALANLADLAGKVTVVVRAESQTGLDKHKLEHAVLEPLRELDLLNDESEKS